MAEQRYHQALLAVIRDGRTVTETAAVRSITPKTIDGCRPG